MKRKINRYDISLIVLIIIVNCLFVYYNSRNIVYSDNNRAMIYSDNELVGEYILNKRFKDEFTITSDSGYNTIVIENNKIWVKDSTCKDKYCQLQGEISGDGQVIVCLPNKLLIKIVGNKKDREIDFIAQ